MMRLVPLFLAVLIAITSQQMAVARGAMQQAAGQVVLCTGQGVQTVILDRQGQPIDVAHICPDCALTLIDGRPSAGQDFCPVVHITKRPDWPVQVVHRSDFHNPHPARGPPVFI